MAGGVLLYALSYSWVALSSTDSWGKIFSPQLNCQPGRYSADDKVIQMSA